MKNSGVFLGLVLAVITAFAARGEAFHRFHLDHNSGLSSNYIRDIGQDGHGFVWVATIDGLNRFDGISFRRFSKENSGLSSNELNSLLADPSDPDIMWVSTRHDGLCKYNYKDCSITEFDGSLRSRNITSLSNASNGKIWLTHYHDAPELLDPATGKTEPLFTVLPDNFPTHSYCAVEDTGRQQLYIGHDGKGFTRVNLATGIYENFRPDASRPDAIIGSIAYCIHVDHLGYVWIGTDKGVSIFDPDRKIFHNISHTAADNSILPGQVRSICEMENGDLWFATTEGGVSILSAGDRVQHNFVFLNIRPSNKWMGNSSDGIDVFTHEQPFFTVSEPFTSQTGLNKKQAVWSITTTADGRVWLGGENEVLEAGTYPPNRITVTHANLGYSSLVKALLGDTKGRLWVGTSYAGIYIYDNKKNNIGVIEIPDTEIKCFAEAADGTVFIGTSLGIFTSADGKSAEPLSIYNAQLPDNFVTSLTFDGDGSLWVGTLGKGAVKFSNKGELIVSYDSQNGLPSNAVNTIMEDRSGNIWIGTREGALQLSGPKLNRMRDFTRADGLVSSFIKSITEDRSGNIWFGTNRGIALYSPHDGKISVYGKTHAMNLESYIEHSAATDRNGRIYFGSLNGLTTFTPNSHNSTHNNSEVILTELFAHDSNGSDHNLEIEIPVDNDHITLPYNKNTFTLRFNNPDITGAANSEYAYTMVGINEVWTKGMVNNEAVYRNLSPGDYKFQAMQRFNGEKWGEPQTLAFIKITPPIWHTWWAILLYVACGIVIIYVLIYFYKHKLNLEKNLAIERENIKNVQTLNEERMVFFTNITHELRTPLSLIIGPIEDLVNDTSINDTNRKKLHTIRTSSMRLLNLINGILEFRKTETHHRKLSVVQDNLANYVREIGLRFKELNSNKDVSIVIDVASVEGVKMYYDPEIITTIINNLMSNAMKYTRTGTITLSLTPVTEGNVKYVDLAVSDTGTGISKDSLPHVFERYYQASNARKTSGTGIGLALTKNLVELHQGNITVASEPGKGTVFTVRLLQENCYPDANHTEAQETETTSTEEGQLAEQPASESKLVLLVVEDDNDMREYIAQSFAEDFKVLTAANGKEGYEIAISDMPDIIVSDIMMPEMDGIEMCNKLKNEMATSHIPIILLTAKDTLRDKEEGYESGADSYITKPFSATLLRARINNIIETRHKLTMRLLNIKVQEPKGKKTDIGGSAQADEVGSRGAPAELSAFDKEFIEKLCRLVEENMEMEEFDQTFLADRMCMSHSTLYRKVKSISGLTPNEFIRKIKLRKAVELLDDKNNTLADIASMTGFGSVAYFRRLFKKEFGVSPSEYSSKSSLHSTPYEDNE